MRNKSNLTKIIEDYMDKQKVIDEVTEKQINVIVKNASLELMANNEEQLRAKGYEVAKIDFNLENPVYFDVSYSFKFVADIINVSYWIIPDILSEKAEEKSKIQCQRALLRCAMFYLFENDEYPTPNFETVAFLLDINILPSKITELRTKNPKHLAIQFFDVAQNSSRDINKEFCQSVKKHLEPFLLVEKHDTFALKKVETEQIALFVTKLENEELKPLENVFSYSMFASLCRSDIYRARNNEQFCQTMKLTKADVVKIGADTFEKFRMREYRYAPMLGEHNYRKFLDIFCSNCKLSDEEERAGFDRRFNPIKKEVSTEMAKFFKEELDKSLNYSDEKVEKLVVESVDKVFFENAFNLTIIGKKEEHLKKTIFECIAYITEIISYDIAPKQCEAKLHIGPQEKAGELYRKNEWIFDVGRYQ